MSSELYEEPSVRSKILLFDEPLGRYVEYVADKISEHVWSDVMGEWICDIDGDLFVCLIDEGGGIRYVDAQIWMYNGHLHAREKTHNWKEEGF
jgi:hypothetical protein